MFEEIIKRNIKEKVRKLRRQGITRMSIANLFQVTPTPPADMATDENVANYRTIFERIAKEVAADFI